ncbi:hypothetical protein PR202_ga16836 [Eleusine coracana subsp. coracana]|uniref:Uncharacterized protein n=1 Tax=Eleusine coracana subsp. coracana TaxID=191504 RepID=A0AAV5CPA1_ELECO|nr:hypothetical protein PR202_ga16836 [Eleusine coracana subsp. coracana]
MSAKQSVEASTHRPAPFLLRVRGRFLAPPHAPPPLLGWSLARAAACLLSRSRRRSLPSPRALPLPGSLARFASAVVAAAELLARQPTSWSHGDLQFSIELARERMDG